MNPNLHFIIHVWKKIWGNGFNMSYTTIFSHREFKGGIFLLIGTLPSSSTIFSSPNKLSHILGIGNFGSIIPLNTSSHCLSVSQTMIDFVVVSIGGFGGSIVLDLVFLCVGTSVKVYVPLKSTILYLG